ncbi:MAG: hypothetical protein ACFFF4_03830 [Candidatus Thorarchaeota archaeon]
MDDSKCITVHCKKCDSPVDIEVSKEEIAAQTDGIFRVMLAHGEPLHAIIAYVDKNCRVRSIEYSDAVQVNQPMSVSVVPQDQVPASMSEITGEPCYQSMCNFDDVKEREKSSFILDKTILKIVCESGTICLSEIRQKTAFLEKALGEKIDLAKVQAVCDRYVKEGLIRNI